MRKPKYIVLHHSLTEDGQTVNTRAIRKWHIENNGWSDIGYHNAIEIVKNEVEVFTGRMLTRQGAHVKEKGMNSKSIGICIVGNYDTCPPPQILWHKCLELVRSYMDIFNIPIKRVVGHRRFAPYKSCPGKMFSMKHFRGQL